MPDVIAGRPEDPGTIPDAVIREAAGQPIEPVWRNELGGTTYRISTDRYVKWAPTGSGLDLAAEADCLTPTAAPPTKIVSSTTGSYGTSALSNERVDGAVSTAAFGRRRVRSRSPGGYCRDDAVRGLHREKRAECRAGHVGAVPG